MKTVFHKASSRGHAQYGWLDSHHTFSFANYYNPERMNFGVLRVLNDDVVSGGRGFDTHPHQNMEIISIPLHGDLEHKDSMGNVTVIKEGDVQIMSAGTGVYHSEFNKNKSEEVKFLQIWMLPNKMNVTPRYDQIRIDHSIESSLQQILSPEPDDDGVWAHQEAWFHLGRFRPGFQQNYTLRNQKNGAYVFVIDGRISINKQDLALRDGMGIWDADHFDVDIQEESTILIMEVPMKASL